MEKLIELGFIEWSKGYSMKLQGAFFVYWYNIKENTLTMENNNSFEEIDLDDLPTVDSGDIEHYIRIIKTIEQIEE